MKTLLKYMRPAHWRLFFITSFLMFIQTWLDLKLPDFMSDITELVQTGQATAGALMSIGGLMLLCAAGATALAISSNYTSARMAASFSRDLRSSIFHKVQTFSKEEIDRFSTASLITRSTNDVVQIQNFVSRGLRMLVRVPIVVGLALFKISTRYWQWTAATAMTVVLVLSVIVLLIKYAHPRFRRMQKLTDEVNRTMRENMTGMRVIRAYNAERYQMDEFEEASFNLMDNERKARSVMLLMPSTNQFANNALTVAIYCIGAFLIMKAGTPAEQLLIFTDMVVFSTYASKMLMGVSSLEMIFNMLPRASTSAERISEILNTEPSITDGGRHDADGAAAAGDGRSTESAVKGGTVEFRNVSFRYQGADGYALENVSFKADRGETIGIIGSTASGKTSLVSLIPRLYDAAEGEVLVDGVNVREYDCGDLRSRMSYVTQGAVLFTGTVASNVAYGSKTGTKEALSKEEQEDKIWKAVETAQAKEFVTGRMDNGINSVVNRGGSNISGGQKQRLAIARGVYREPEIYIFDDAFSALDYKTDRELREALRVTSENATVLIVASRIATIRNADRILVMDEGRIVGEGTHEELMQSCDVYREIAFTQLSEEELK